VKNVFGVGICPVLQHTMCHISDDFNNKWLKRHALCTINAIWDLRDQHLHLVAPVPQNHPNAGVIRHFQAPAECCAAFHHGLLQCVDCWMWIMAFSFLGTSLLGTTVPWSEPCNFSSLELSLPGAKVPQTFIPWSEKASYCWVLMQIGDGVEWHAAHRLSVVTASAAESSLLASCVTDVYWAQRRQSYWRRGQQPHFLSLAFHVASLNFCHAIRKFTAVSVIRGLTFFLGLPSQMLNQIEYCF